MVACRSSRLFELTRSSSPWICDLTLFGASSRMILPIFLASSWAIPCLTPASIRYSLPEANGSPASRLRREMPRLMSLDSNTSSTAFTRSSVFAFMSTFSPL